MANKNKTPLIRPLRKEGGTLYVFPSATEDIGLNINSRMNKVALSHYALLDIPECESYEKIVNEQKNQDSTSDIFNKNRFQPGFIGGRMTASVTIGSENRSDSIGSWETAASLQNYMMYFETLLRNQEDYNYQLYKTVTERAFWKWLKETGAIRWEHVTDPSNGKPTGYFREVSDSANYKRVVKCFSEIAAGNSLSTEFGMFNETYITVPSSYGESPIYFQIDEDDNYKCGKVYTSEELQSGLLEGRNEYVDSNIEEYQYTINNSWSDILMNMSEETINEISSSSNGGSTNTGAVIVDQLIDTWYNSLYNVGIYNLPAYVTDDRVAVNTNTPSNIDVTMKVIPNGEGETVFTFKRSKLDAVSIVKNITEYKEILKDQIKARGEFGNVDLYGDVQNDTEIDMLNWDNLSIKFHKNVDSKFTFNAVLLYYTIYDANNSVALATNLFGILFLDGVNDENLGTAGTGSNMDFTFKKIEKRQSNENGFGTGYSFRVNIKTSSIYDNTDALISDNTTANSVLTDNFNDVIYSLHNAITLLRGNVYVTQNIADNYNALKSHVQSNDTELKSLRNDLNTYLQYKYENIISDTVDSDVVSARTITSVSNAEFEANGNTDNDRSIDFSFYTNTPSGWVFNEPVLSVNKYRAKANRLDVSSLYTNGVWEVINNSDFNDYETVDINKTIPLIIESFKVGVLNKPTSDEIWDGESMSYKTVISDDGSTGYEYFVDPTSSGFSSPYGTHLVKNSIVEYDQNFKAVNYAALVPVLLAAVKYLMVNYKQVNKLSDDIVTQVTSTLQDQIATGYQTEIKDAMDDAIKQVQGRLSELNTIASVISNREAVIADNVASRIVTDSDINANIASMVDNITTNVLTELVNDKLNSAITGIRTDLNEEVTDLKASVNDSLNTAVQNAIMNVVSVQNKTTTDLENLTSTNNDTLKVIIDAVNKLNTNLQTTVSQYNNAISALSNNSSDGSIVSTAIDSMIFQNITGGAGNYTTTDVSISYANSNVTPTQPAEPAEP